MPTKTLRFPSAFGNEDLDRIENALCQLAGMRDVTMARAMKGATVHWEAPTSWEDIERAVRNLGYVPEEVEA